MLSGIARDGCYMVLGSTLEENLVRVLTRIRRAGPKLKPPKRKFARLSVEHQGHVVLAEGLQTDPKKLQAVKQFPVPMCSSLFQNTALSRFPLADSMDNNPAECGDEDDLPEQPPKLLAIMTYLDTGILPEDERWGKQIGLTSLQYTVLDCILYCVVTNGM